MEVGSSTVAELTDLGQARLSVSVATLYAHVTRFPVVITRMRTRVVCACFWCFLCCGVCCCICCLLSCLSPLVAHLLLLVCACVKMAHLCMVLAIQVVLVASCLCRGPPVTACTIRGRTRSGYRVPRAQRGQRWGFRSGRRFASCRRGGGRGVNFRPAGGVRVQVAGSLPGRQPGTGTRRVRGGADTPSLHPEVPGIQFVSPRYGLDIRQSMGWTKVCGTTRSGIWVPKGNARSCMFPANLDHLRVEMDEAGYMRDRLGYARARLSVFIQVWTWSSRQTAN